MDAYNETLNEWYHARMAHDTATQALRALVEQFVAEDTLQPMTRACAYCGTTYGVVMVQAAAPSTTHGICDLCLCVEMARLEHPVTGGA